MSITEADRNLRLGVEDMNRKSRDLTIHIDRVVDKYFDELDRAIDEIYELLKAEDVSLSEVNHYIGLLPVLMYQAGNSLENLGVNGDLSTASYKDSFNEYYMKSEGKTVQDKTSDAEQHTIQEKLIQNIYQRAYKKCKLRLEYAAETLASLKKIHAWKMTELERLNSR